MKTNARHVRHLCFGAAAAAGVAIAKAKSPNDKSIAFISAATTATTLNSAEPTSGGCAGAAAVPGLASLAAAPVPHRRSNKINDSKTITSTRPKER
uniref:Putative secreted protein n=1 Tax=Anopheles darlingi TaxID=43151 RepID=A0A2M4DG89_ANODA